MADSFVSICEFFVSPFPFFFFYWLVGLCLYIYLFFVLLLIYLFCAFFFSSCVCVFCCCRGTVSVVDDASRPVLHWPLSRRSKNVIRRLYWPTDHCGWCVCSD